MIQTTFNSFTVGIMNLLRNSCVYTDHVCHSYHAI